MGKFVDLTGKKINRLKVLFLCREKNKNGNKIWAAHCQCGRITFGLSSNITSGHKKSCGCLHKDTIRKDNLVKNHPLYFTWEGMRSRCKNPRAKNFKHYGGRGIKICKRWDIFKNFAKDMGEKPSRKHSIERIDNDGDYSPENCRWATQKEQTNNTRRSLIEIDSKKMSAKQWCQKYNINYGTYNNRVYRGWSKVEALQRPVGKQGRKK